MAHNTCSVLRNNEKRYDRRIGKNFIYIELRNVFFTWKLFQGVLLE